MGVPLNEVFISSPHVKVTYFHAIILLLIQNSFPFNFRKSLKKSENITNKLTVFTSFLSVTPLSLWYLHIHISLNLFVGGIFCSVIVIFIFVVSWLHKHLGTGEWMYGCWVDALIMWSPLKFIILRYSFEFSVLRFE